MNNIYMAKTDNPVLTRITVEVYDKRYIVESPYSDEDIIENLLTMVRSICVNATYNDRNVLEAMRDFAEEGLSVYNDNDGYGE